MDTALTPGEPAPRSRMQHGQLLVLVAISLVILVGIAGLAIDAGRGFGVKAKLNAAVDAAAIAGARALAQGATPDARIATAKQAVRAFYTANFPDKFLGATLVPLTDDNIAINHDPSGYWSISVAGSATMPVYFMGIRGFGMPGIDDDIAVGATGAAIRRDLDIVLVLDTSGSLGPPTSSAGTFATLQNAAVNSFLNRFNAGANGDRVGVVSFASGAVVDLPIARDGSRGFDREQAIEAINALSVGGSTASAEGMRLALNDINRVPAVARSSLRIIVFFSDGAPNVVPANFNNAGAPVSGGLYSETDGPGNSHANRMYRSDRRNSEMGTYSGIDTLPDRGFELTDESGAVTSSIALASFNGRRTLAGNPYANTRCNVNKAARNMVENVADAARSQGIVVYAIALGARVNSLEIDYCSYDTSEYGERILKRLSNATDSDTRNGNQPTGLYVWAENASDLDNAFSTVASEIVRLTQ